MKLKIAELKDIEGILKLHNKYQIAQGNYTLKTKEFKKSYSFKPISTRKYYSGIHYLSIVVNDVVLQSVEFYFDTHNKDLN